MFGYARKPRLTRITGLTHSAAISLKCGGDAEPGHSARANETAERFSQKGKVYISLHVLDLDLQVVQLSFGF